MNDARRAKRCTLVLVVASIVVLALAVQTLIELVRVWTFDEPTSGDVALIEIETRRVWSADPPALGPYSRYGWRHPGPLLFYMLAVPYRLLGSRASALQTGALMVNAASIAGVCWLMYRRGVAALAAMGSALMLMIAALDREGIGSAWNVPITLVPLTLLVLGCWSLGCGDGWAAPIVVATYGFVLHSHVGSAVVATPVVVVSAIVAIVARRRPGSAWRRDLVAWTGGLAVLLVSPMLVDVLRDPPGNLGRLLRWSVTHDEPTTGWVEVMRLLGRTSSLSFGWQSRPPRFLLTVSTEQLGLLPGVLLVMLLVVTALAARHRLREELCLCGIMWLFWVSAALALRAIVAPPAWWLVEWLQPLGWLTIGAIVVTAWRLCAGRLSPGDGMVVGALSGLSCVAIGAVAITVSQGVDVDARRTGVSAPLTTFADAIETLAPREGTPVQIDARDFSSETLLAGVVNELDSRNVAACVPESLAYKFPEPTTCATATVSLILRSEAAVDAAPAGTTLLAVSDPLAPDERAAVDQTRATILAALEADGMSQLAPVVDTPLVAEVLLDDTRGRLGELTAEIVELDRLHDRSGQRFALYIHRTP